MKQRTTCLAVSFLIACTFLAGCDSQPEIEQVQETPQVAGTVTVVIDFNGRKPKKEILVDVEDDTVMSILTRARDKGQLEFVSRGKGETAFVSAIDGVENEKAAGDNWTYRVNGQLGDRSCGVFQVKSQDEILWLFGKYP